MRGIYLWHQWQLNDVVSVASQYRDGVSFGVEAGVFSRNVVCDHCIQILSRKFCPSISQQVACLRCKTDNELALFARTRHFSEDVRRRLKLDCHWAVRLFDFL